MCREALPEVWEGSGGPTEGSGMVGRPSRRYRRPSLWAWRGREPLPEVWEGSKGLPKGPRGASRGPAGVKRP